MTRGLLSYLKPDEYLEAFARAKFEPLVSLVNVSTPVGRYARRFPDRWARMKQQHGLRGVDLLCAASAVILQKPRQS